MLLSVVENLPPAWAIPAIIIGVLFQFFWMSIVSVVLYRVSKTDRNIESMQKQLTEASDKLITERFRVVTHSVNNHAQTFTGALDLMSAHVKERDAAFAKLIETNPHQDLKLIKALTELRVEVRDSTCSSEDFKALRDEHRHTRDQISQVKDQLNRVGTVDDFRKLLQETRHV